MMGSVSRVADTRLAFGDIIAILKLLAEPDGLKKAAAELEKAHSAAVDDIGRSNDLLEATKAKLAESIEQHERDTKALQGREAELSAREAELKDAFTRHEADQVALADQVQAHKLAEDDLAKRHEDLRTQMEALAVREREMLAAHTGRVEQAEADASNRHKALDEQQQQLNERSLDIAKDEALLAKRSKMVDAAQKKAEAAEQAAMAVKAEFEQKLLQLRSLVAGS